MIALINCVMFYFAIHVQVLKFHMSDGDKSTNDCTYKINNMIFAIRIISIKTRI